MQWIVCHNPAEAERDAAKRQAAVERLSAELDRIAAARARDAAKRKAGKRAPADDVHVWAECALRDHPTLGRWLRQLPSGRLALDRKKISAEERLDGKYLLSTSDPDLTAEDVALGYKNLLEAERGFRDLKEQPRAPRYRAPNPRPRPPLLARAAAHPGRRAPHRPHLAADRGRARPPARRHPVRQRRDRHPDHPLSDAQASLRACRVSPPPRVTTLHSA